MSRCRHMCAQSLDFSTDETMNGINSFVKATQKLAKMKAFSRYLPTHLRVPAFRSESPSYVLSSLWSFGATTQSELRQRLVDA